jgi:hypothetical protein
VSRFAPIALVFSAALADHAGAHTLAFDALLVAVPVTAVAGLRAVGDRLEGRAERAPAYVWGLVLALLLVAAAVRAPALGDPTVPPAARSALTACVLVFCLQAMAALAAELRRD